MRRISHIIWCAAVCIVSLAASSHASPRCDRVLCYFCGDESRVQWRIYDPASRTNTLFLVLPGTTEVRWDSPHTKAEYRVGDDLFGLLSTFRGSTGLS